MKEVKVGDLVAVWCLDEDLADYDSYGAPDHIGVVLTRPSYMKSVFDYIVLTSSCKVIWIFRNDFVKVISKSEALCSREHSEMKEVKVGDLVAPVYHATNLSREYVALVAGVVYRPLRYPQYIVIELPTGKVSYWSGEWCAHLCKPTE